MSGGWRVERGKRGRWGRLGIGVRVVVSCLTLGRNMRCTDGKEDCNIASEISNL